MQQHCGEGRRENANTFSSAAKKIQKKNNICPFSVPCASPKLDPPAGQTAVRAKKSEVTGDEMTGET
jgi:hypothetical protein